MVDSSDDDAVVLDDDDLDNLTDFTVQAKLPGARSATSPVNGGRPPMPTAHTAPATTDATPTAIAVSQHYGDETPTQSVGGSGGGGDVSGPPRKRPLFDFSDEAVGGAAERMADSESPSGSPHGSQVLRSPARSSASLVPHRPEVLQFSKR